MVQAASENGYTRVVVEALNSVIDSLRAGDGSVESHSEPEELRGSARSLFDTICSVSPSAAREIGGARFLSQQLDQLARGGYRVVKVRSRGTFEWRIPYDFDKDALSGRPEDEERPEGDIDATGAYVEQAKEVK